jgi:hypothetical protein
MSLLLVARPNPTIIAAAASEREASKAAEQT